MHERPITDVDAGAGVGVEGVVPEPGAGGTRRRVAGR